MGTGAGALDSEVAAAEDGLVDAAMAAFTEELLVGEPICGGLESAVVEVLDLDGRRLGIGSGNGRVCSARKVSHHDYYGDDKDLGFLVAEFF